jgi:hypothetical protein
MCDCENAAIWWLHIQKTDTENHEDAKFFDYALGGRVSKNFISVETNSRGKCKRASFQDTLSITWSFEFAMKSDNHINEWKVIWK